MKGDEKLALKIGGTVDVLDHRPCRAGSGGSVLMAHPLHEKQLNIVTMRMEYELINSLAFLWTQ